ncbi:hypothetical protein OG625_37445 [Streptomyces sp. NBC_01351]|uniref:hypothetical protein n=1 Tax=Streptomyces sp. NBC_01351 TaxID=2903833 RepID=UPI002E2EF8F8|nr:hypothetical protein [Streptomyces sp. NBC_01351]
MIGWVRGWRRRRAAARDASLVEECVVVAADADEPLMVVFEPMGSLYEVPAGEHLTVSFKARPGEGGDVEHRADYVSVCAGLSGTMTAWTAAGAEIDLLTGCPEATGPATQ